MAFWGDYHTHTTYSHGKGTIEDNVLAAVNLGLKEVGITDHGFKHMTFNVRRMDWPYMERDVAALRQKYPQINIYLGLETNFNSADGHIDLLPSEFKMMDVVICGYHFMVKSDRFKDFFEFWLPNFFQQLTHKSSAKMYARNTEMYIKALEKYEIDVISHPNYGIKIDVIEVAKACKHFGTYFELNGKRINLTKEQLIAVADTGVEFICNSDAHVVSNVGNFQNGINALDCAGIPYTQVANWERIPQFRSAKLKESLRTHEFIL